MPRKVAEWIGSSPDSKVPEQVKLRVLITWNRTCYLTGLPIRPGDKFDMEHVKPLSMGGEHRESNLRPALRNAHKVKSAKEATERAKADATAKRAYGITGPKQQIKSAGMPKSRQSAEREAKREKTGRIGVPPRRNIFTREPIA